MKKKLSSMMLIGICGVMLTATMLTADESSEKQHAPVGVRSESLETRQDQLKTREEMAAQNSEATAASNKKDSKSRAKSMIPMKNSMRAKGLFSTSHPAAYQNPVSVSYYGDSIELMDGSIWIIDPSDASRTINWYPTDLVVITPNHSWFSQYAFRLTNQNTGVSVAATLHLGPIAPVYGSYYTHWVTAIDYYYNIVYLEDGSIWNMSTFDSSIVNQWIVGDIVIVGVNDGWLSSSKPNVLINVSTLNFAAGSASF